MIAEVPTEPVATKIDPPGRPQPTAEMEEETSSLTESRVAHLMQ